MINLYPMKSYIPEKKDLSSFAGQSAITSDALKEQKNRYSIDITYVKRIQEYGMAIE
jgi:hypothetical protein